MACNQRQKGARGEREAAKLLRDLGFAGARRGQQFRGGYDTPDVICEALPDILFEVKQDQSVKPGTKRFEDVWSKLASDAVGPTGFVYPALLWRHDRGPWHMTFIAENPHQRVTVTGPEEIKRALRWLQGLEEEVA
jgi:Holliday junction resolvase